MKILGTVWGVLLALAIIFSVKFIINPEVKWLLTTSCFLYGISLGGLGTMLGCLFDK